MKYIVLLIISLALAGCERNEPHYLCGDDGYLYRVSDDGGAAYAIYTDFRELTQQRCIKVQVKK